MSDTERDQVNAVARVLMAEWERVEGEPVNASFVATFADMGRAILASDWLAAHDAQFAEHLSDELLAQSHTHAQTHNPAFCQGIAWAAAHLAVLAGGAS